MRLSEMQRAFAAAVPRLMLKALDLGFEVTLGDAYRDPRVHGELGIKLGYGHPRSGHKQRLAIDLNLWKGGELITTTEGHQELGAWWESQSPFARWGGRFADGNHYSFEYEGVK